MPGFQPLAGVLSKCVRCAIELGLQSLYFQAIYYGF